MTNEDLLAESWLAEHDPEYDATKRNWGIGDAQWPKSVYAADGSVEVKKGRVQLQPGFDGMAWQPSASDSPFGDPELVDRPSKARRIDGHNGVMDEAGEGHDQARWQSRKHIGKRPVKAKSDDVLFHIVAVYLILERCGIDLDEIEPKRGRRNAQERERAALVVKTLAHTLALLRYRHGIPASSLEIASQRKQQTVSSLIRPYADRFVPPEDEPWASRRIANAKRLGNQIEFFQPNRPCGEPHWALQTSADLALPSNAGEASFQFPRRSQPETQRGARSDALAPASWVSHLSFLNLSAHIDDLTTRAHSIKDAHT